MTPDPHAAIERVFREESSRVVAWLTANVCRFDVAEDALQDALGEALRTWEERGVPDDPAAWVATVARRRAVDRNRVLQRKRQRESSADLTEDIPEELERAAVNEYLDSSLDDEQLRLVFMCCHPSLKTDAQIALTLRTLGGLETGEIASAFLVPEPTLAQRIVRAKRKVVEAGIPFRVPIDAELPNRVPAVLRVVYLIFNEGYSASSGASPIRRELCAEAMRLARKLVDLMPDEPEVRGLLALLLLLDSRRETRTDADGDVVLLEDQDRTRWDRGLIELGESHLHRALALRRAGPYQVQAAIAAVHAEARDHAHTDWAQVVGLYDQLRRFDDGPVVRLNRAAALAMRDGPVAGLQALAELEQPLAGYVYFYSTRAELQRRQGDLAAARADLERACQMAPTDADRRLLERRLNSL